MAPTIESLVILQPLLSVVKAAKHGGVALQRPAENTVLKNGLTSFYIVHRHHSVFMLWFPREKEEVMWISLEASRV